MLLAATLEEGALDRDEGELPRDGYGGVVLVRGERAGVGGGAEVATGVFGEGHEVL